MVLLATSKQGPTCPETMPLSFTKLGSIDQVTLGDKIRSQVFILYIDIRMQEVTLEQTWQSEDLHM